MTLFDLPVWQCQQQSSMGTEEERLCEYYVVEAHLLRVFKPHTLHPHNLHSRTLAVVSDYLYHMDSHYPTANARGAYFYKSVCRDQLLPPCSLPNAAERWHMQRGNPTLLSMSFVNYWMQSLYDTLTTHRRGIHHRALKGMNKAALYLAACWISTQQVVLTDELRSLLAPQWQGGTTWFDPTLRQEIEDDHTLSFDRWYEEEMRGGGDLDHPTVAPAAVLPRFPERPSLVDSISVMPVAVYLHEVQEAQQQPYNTPHVVSNKRARTS